MSIRPYIMRYVRYFSLEQSAGQTKPKVKKRKQDSDTNTTKPSITTQFFPLFLKLVSKLLVKIRLHTSTYTSYINTHLKLYEYYRNFKLFNIASRDRENFSFIHIKSKDVD